MADSNRNGTRRQRRACHWQLLSQSSIQWNQSWHMSRRLPCSVVRAELTVTRATAHGFSQSSSISTITHSPYVCISRVTVANVGTTINKLNLGQYTAPLVGKVSAVAGPYFQKASKNLLPILSPYMDLAAPYMGGAKPHLDKVTQAEVLLIVGQYDAGDTTELRACL